MKEYIKPEIEVLSQYAHLMEVINPGTPKEHFDVPEYRGLESLLDDDPVNSLEIYEETKDSLGTNLTRLHRKSLWDE